MDGKLALKLKTITNSLVECCKCEDRFKGPRVLPCGHTICLPCLEEETSGRSVGSSFSCPKCRQSCVIPEGGVEVFARNLLVATLGNLIKPQRLGSSSGEQAGPTCATSEPDDPHGSIVSFCTECAEYYCEECDRWHKKSTATKNHNLLAIGDLSEQEMKIAVANAVMPKCERHNEKIMLHCNHCKVSICTVCANSGHKNHDIEDLANAAEKRRLFLSRAQGSASEYMTKINGMREALLETKARAEEDRATAQQWVEYTANLVLQRAQEEKEKMTSEIDLFHQNLADDINASLDQYDTQLALTKKMMLISSSLHNDYNANVHAAGLSKKLQEIQASDISNLELESSIMKRQGKLIPLSELVGNVQTEKKPQPPLAAVATDDGGKDDTAIKDMGEAIKDIIQKLQLVSDKDILGMTMLYDLVHLTHKKDPKVYVYNPDGTIKAEVEIPELVGPQAMATICPDSGRIAIVCSSKNTLHLLTLTRDHAIAAHDKVKLGYIPQDVNIDLLNNHLLVGRMNSTLQILELNGSVKEAIECGDVAWVQSAVKLSDGGLLVADHKANQIVKCDEAGGTIHKYRYSQPGTGPLKGGNKTLLQDSQGNVFVCDTVNSGIHLLTAQGKFIPYLLTPQQGVRSPTSICLDETSQYLYVANTDEETNQKEVSAYPYNKLMLLLSMPLTKCKYTMKLTVNKIDQDN